MLMNRGQSWNPWADLARMQRDVEQLFGRSAGNGVPSGEYPAVNIWSNEDNGILTAELPGVNPDSLDITVKNNTLTLRGNREPENIKEGESWLRRERGSGAFVRSFRLPFEVDAEKVKAQYQKGILQLVLPRSAADKPRKIQVKGE